MAGFGGFWGAIAVAGLVAAPLALAQDGRGKERQEAPVPSKDKKDKDPKERDAKDPKDARDSRTTGEVAEDIATQPVRDVGIMKTKVPPLLVEVRKDPYSFQGAANCRQIGASLEELNAVLGPDYEANPDPRYSRKMKVTGHTVAGLIVPFRGIVREVSGAASAQRELDASIDAGLARRGFLRGLQVARKCKGRPR
ncbi:hypothetical protein ACFQ1E_04150 [Sphingomonas canadensis]|uniref:Uncharacterized protein n=1 Tax=Sphingomonas canadensis TaxID=1219257 RepID=A0ABW3H221_9SPHN|nr:hypothetical protein [Sphingomonas canadensis]MCW3834564.1 hypothetical protein [Sphingomonas canadensis]